MVGDTLEIRQYIRPDEAHFHAALAVSHTKNVACPHIFLHLVDDLLQRFNVLRLGTVVVNKRVDLKVKYFIDRRGNNFKIPCCFR